LLKIIFLSFFNITTEYSIWLAIPCLLLGIGDYISISSLKTPKVKPLFAGGGTTVTAIGLDVIF